MTWWNMCNSAGNMCIKFLFLAVGGPLFEVPGVCKDLSIMAGHSSSDCDSVWWASNLAMFLWSLHHECCFPMHFSCILAVGKPRITFGMIQHPWVPRDDRNGRQAGKRSRKFTTKFWCILSANQVRSPIRSDPKIIGPKFLCKLFSNVTWIYPPEKSRKSGALFSWMGREKNPFFRKGI